jgi:site-specific DNA-methyltransferase (adenine-specific)|tara:strand:- start:111 stop:1415 length:1305 start_codon:yes stop_codon:yes gene_type:complete
MISFLQGDVFDKLEELDDNSIDCVVTSPPYWGLRDYGVQGQLGLEPTYQEHIQNIVKLFRIIKPKLKDSATVWLNYGDSYAATVNGTKVKDQIKNKVQFAGKYLIKGDDRTFRDKPFSTIQGSLKPKDLVMIPNRIAIALQEDGWWIRSEIIWHKPNPMPESTKDRPTSAHEKIWLITKSKKYYYDADAIREPLTSSSLTRLNQPNLKNQKGSTRGNGGMKSNGNMKAVFGKYQTDENEKKHRQGMSKIRGTKLVETRPKLPSQKEFVNYLRNKTTIKDLVENTDIKKTTIEHWFRKDEIGFAFPSVEDWNKIKDLINDWTNTFNNIDYGLTYTESHLDEIKNNPIGKNKRNVWTVTTKPCKEAHFATFPKDLIEPCIKAGCPEGGVVLDPFGGSGTTGIVAKSLNRTAILIELNPEYIEIAKKRIDKELGMFK